jgi:hypothetical protein
MEKTFQLDELVVDHEVTKDGILRITYRGTHLRGSYAEGTDLYRRYDEKFNAYLDHIDGLVELSAGPDISAVECHIEDLEDAMSRTRQSLYRMLQRMRPLVRTITIYGTTGKPAQNEHFQMTKVFVTKLSKQPGAPLKLIDRGA